jgi:hypothetical protein
MEGLNDSRTGSVASLATLPDEMLHAILYSLQFKERMAVSSCSHALRRQLQSKKLWALSLSGSILG